MSAMGWVGVDLDCTLAVFPHNFPDVGPPIPAMLHRVKRLLDAGVEVRIFTARVSIMENSPADLAFAADQRTRIEAWCVAHLGRKLPVTAMKDFEMILLLDDRCVQVEANTGRLLGVADPQFDSLRNLLA